jgi:prepilin-type N-terminal cleavage/methylation domain-containing protein
MKDSPQIELKSRSSPGPTHHLSHGFSLIEILVVLAITAIILGISVPLFTSQSRSQAKAEVQKLSELIQVTRAHALSQKVNTFLCFSVDHQQKVVAAFSVASVYALSSNRLETETTIPPIQNENHHLIQKPIFLTKIEVDTLKTEQAGKNLFEDPLSGIMGSGSAWDWASKTYSLHYAIRFSPDYRSWVEVNSPSSQILMSFLSLESKPQRQFLLQLNGITGATEITETVTSSEKSTP